MVLKKGEVINGRYRLVSNRGSGTFGEVWQAWDEVLDMEVAIKIYIALDARGIGEFKTEYKTAFSLNHPNLLHATYFDVVDKRPYLVMPYCPESSEDLVGNISEKEAWRFIKDVSSGLAYLHSRDIIHRDIKPDNILRDAQGDFLISDFGVSVRMRSTLRRNSVRELSESTTQGTIGYMGPEMFSSDPSAVKATDIWALGSTLFELLEGELPFFGQGGVMQLHGAEIPNLKGSWSDPLREVVKACLARETWDRPTARKLVSYADALLSDGSAVPVMSVALSSSSMLLVEGDKMKLSAKVAPSSAADQSVTWATSDASVAVVNSNGLVTAMAPGSAVIIVKTKDQGETATCQVEVEARKIPVEWVSLSRKALVLTEEQSLRLEAEVGPSDAYNKKLSWKSSDETVAVVDSDGTVTAKSPGEAIITSITDDQGKTAACKVTVKARPVQVKSVSLSHNIVSLVEGDALKLDAFIEPTNATNKDVTWSSSDPSVAKVGQDGNVVAKAPGETVITVKTDDQGKAASCHLIVEAREVPVNNVTLSQRLLAIMEGDSAILVAKVAPADATNKNVSWVSSEESVASVDSTGTVTAVSPGEAIITVVTDDQGKTATCKVTVKAKPVQVESVSLSQTIISLVEGDAFRLEAFVGPTNVANKSVTWTSSNPSVAKVGQDGNVVAKVPGEAVITVRTTDRRKTATCRVIVEARVVDVYSVTLSNAILELVEGDSAKLVANVAPSDATNKSIFWKSSDESIAVVGPDGTVSAKSPGTATITVVTEDHGLTSECQVSVEKRIVPVRYVKLSESSLSLAEGDKSSLKATVLPDDASNKEVNWSSSNPSVVSVNSEGDIMAVSPGKAKITASSVENGEKANCKVVVKALPKSPVYVPEEVAPEDDDRKVASTGIGKRMIIWLIALAVLGGLGYWTNDKYDWINKIPNLFSGLKTDSGDEGTKEDDDKKEEEDDEINDEGDSLSKQEPIAVEGINISPTSLTLELGGRPKSITVNIEPEDASDQSVKWSSNKVSIATVKDGTVHAVAEGTATITVETMDGRLKKTCVVTVRKPEKDSTDDEPSLQDFVVRGDWPKVKQLADANDAAACYEYAKHCLVVGQSSTDGNIKRRLFGEADAYAKKAVSRGNSNGNDIIVELRDREQYYIATTNDSAGSGSSVQPISTDWAEVKKRADAGDASACYEYANHCLVSGQRSTDGNEKRRLFSEANNYANKAVNLGNSKGEAIISTLREKEQFFDIF